MKNPLVSKHPLKKCSSSFAVKRERSKGTNERTSKNLQRRADVSRSIVKEQSNHASRKDPRQKEKRREREREREGERTIAFSRRSNDRPWKGVAFQKDVCTWRRRIRNISSLSLCLSLPSPFDLYHPSLFISPWTVSVSN